MVQIRFFLISIIVVFSVCRPASVEAQEFKIISFNIRGDLKHDGHNRWKYRRVGMAKFFESVNPDILCLQEAKENQINDLKRHFHKLNIVCDSCKKGNVHFFLNREKFAIINQGYFGLSEKPDSIGYIGWDAKYPRMAIWANLKCLKTGRIVFVINTHLDNVGRLARLNSIKQIMDTIPILSQTENVILTGDFNSSEKSSVYKFVTRHQLKDTYHHSPSVEGVNYTFHGFGKREVEKRKKIDHIFVSQQLDVKNVLIPQEKPKDGVYLSDHNPVITTITLN